MGGSSVPSSTTQTTMLDPTRQAALKKSMGYFDKWANSYNGPTYKGPLVAGRTADWYKAQDMAHKLSNRFAEGGITSVRRFEGGGSTVSLTNAPSTSMPVSGVDPNQVTLTVDPNQTALTNAPSTSMPVSGVDPNQVSLTMSNEPAPASAPWWQENFLSPQQAVNMGVVPASVFTQQELTNPYNLTSQTSKIDASLGPTQPSVTTPNTGTNTGTVADSGDYTAKVSSGNAGNPNLFAQMVTNANLGGLFGLTGVQPNQVSNTYTTPGTIGATTITSPYTGGTITAPEKVTGAYTAGTIAAPSSISSGYTAGTISPGTVSSNYTAGTISPGDKIANSYTAGTITPGTVSYNYTPEQMDKIKSMTSDYTAGTHTIKDVTADKWNQAAMDQYMSPYTKGVVDIALREAERQRGIERLKENTAATQSGAFGGYRQGVVEAEGERNYNQLLSDITTKGQQEAYNAAVAQFNADRAVDVAVQQFNENNSMENFKALEQAKQTAAQLKLTAEQNNASNTINAYQAVQQAKQAAAAGNLSASQANAANALQAAIAMEQARQQEGQMGISAATANAANALQASIASEQAKQQQGQMGLTASTANAANALQASIASEQAKQQQGQMGLTASTANAANQLNAAIAQEQAKQSAGQQAITAGSTNATNALNAAIANEQAKQQAGQMSLTASTANAANALQASIAKEQAAQQAAQMSTTAAQNNVQNGLSALNVSINAYNAGLTGAQGLAAIDTAYNSNVKLAQEMMLSTDASERAAGQALMGAMIEKSKELDALDLTKAQAASGTAGLSQNNSNVQVKTSGAV
jgi:uncharacterized protein YktA (UPF0223 family)